ncbi:MAG: hypothetical protein R3249_04265 [Nitriliruptorales bacterium]|nr:hypothetical protein [Nitriliruptorales bacterium]
MAETPENVQESPSAAAWRRFLERLEEAGEVVSGPLGAIDERDRAEGHRHLLRLVSIASEMLLEKGDTDHPEFIRWMNAHRKMLGDNPHTIYDVAIIDPDTTYVIRGTMGTPTYLGVCAYGTAEGGARRIVGNVDDTDIGVVNGRFEVWVAPEGSAHVPDGAAVLTLEPDATDVLVRQYFHDPASQVEATYTIEAVPDPGPSRPLTEDELVRRLDAVGAYVRDIVEVEATLSALMATATPGLLRHGDDYTDLEGEQAPPPIDPTVVAKAMPSPSIQYSGSWVDDLGEHEQVVVSGALPTCRYFSIQLLNRWMESGNWTTARVFVTDRDLEVVNGRFRAVIAHADPGEGTWIDTNGWTSFSIAVRALGADDPMEIDFTREARPTA